MRCGCVAAILWAQFAPCAHAAPLFVERTERLGAHQPCRDTNEGCYSSYVLLADLEGDGDLDLVFASGGGYYEPGAAEPMAVYLNGGGAQFVEASARVTGGFKSRLRQVAAGDLDGDGDLDLVAPGGYGRDPDAVFMNDGHNPPRLRDEGATRLGTSSRAGATRLGDLDGDGDLDLVITDWGDMPPASPGTAHVYTNDGGGRFRELTGAVPADTSSIGTGPIDADLFDADGDFDLDLLLASRENESLLFENRGDGHFTAVNDRLPDQPGPYVYGPDVCDVDGDGDLDLWLDNGGPDATEQLLVNDGHGSFRDETANHVRGNDAADDNEVQCADLDDDGDFDALIASLSSDERALMNDGRGQFAGQAGLFPQLSDATLGLDLGDLDGDGRLDVVTAQGESGAYLNRLYLGSAAQKVDTTPPRIRAVAPESAPRDDTLWVRFAVSDRATSDAGPRLLRAALETRDGERVVARFLGGDLFLARLPLAATERRYRACAVDVAGNEACSAELTAPALPSTAPASRPADCSTVRRPGAPWASVVALLAFAWTRRRRSGLSAGRSGRDS